MYLVRNACRRQSVVCVKKHEKTTKFGQIRAILALAHFLNDVSRWGQVRNGDVVVSDWPMGAAKVADNSDPWRGGEAMQYQVGVTWE